MANLPITRFDAMRRQRFTANYFSGAVVLIYFWFPATANITEPM